MRNGLLYLVCTFSGYQDVRQLLLHRMQQAEVANEPCAVPDGFDLDGYIRDQGFDLARGRPDIHLRFRFRCVPANALYETPLSADQVITPLADKQWVEVSASVADTDQLRWWLLGFGNQVEV